MEKLNWMDFKDSTNPIVDSYRGLRINLQKQISEKKGNILILTSAARNAEQSTIVAGLAIVLAQSGSKTLVIDCNQLAQAQHVLFDIPNQGITDAIVAGTTLNNYVQPCAEQDNLFILPFGSAAQGIGFFLHSETMQQFIADNRALYDYILVDVTAVASSADAVTLAPKTDGVLLVVGSGVDHLNELLEAKVKLKQAGGRVLGCILSEVKVTM